MTLLIGIFVFFCNVSSFAQEVLSIDDAIKLALQKNYAVMIEKNNVEIAKAQNNIGNAGMSPSVSLNGGFNFSVLNSHQEFNTGAVQERTGAKSQNLSASINASWTIFDGMKMFAVKKRLGMNEQLSSIALKQQMENTVYDVIAAYYNVVKIQQLIKAAQQNLSIYEEQKKIAQKKFEIGSDSKVDFLLAQSEENKVKSEVLQQQILLLNAKVNLNVLLNRSSDTDFKAEDNIVSTYNPNFDELKKSTPQNNPAILISKQNELIFNQSVKEARSANLPLVQLQGAYNLTRANSQAGFLFMNRQTGPMAGITASWLLFNGGKNNRLVKERNILALNQKYITEQTQLQVDALVYINYQAFLLNKQILEMETQNLTDANEVQNISLERYKIGKAAFLETIQTQKNLEDTQTRYINALYNMKISETELLKTNGELVR
ncbi:MAG: TolC family protein [Bacteroidetes bacterium]|nr:TolC family protein [Bacteroidota bacterium]